MNRMTDQRYLLEYHYRDPGFSINRRSTGCLSLTKNAGMFESSGSGAGAILAR